MNPILIFGVVMIGAGISVALLNRVRRRALVRVHGRQEVERSEQEFAEHSVIAYPVDALSMLLASFGVLALVAQLTFAR